MAISSYLKRCGYQQNELKNVLYLIPKSATKKVHIDGDEAYVEYSGDTLSIIKIKGNNLAFQEDTSFDDRFRFDKTITLTVDGYITFKDFYSKYYAIIEDKSGTFWMVNADFPSYITYTYTLNDGENKTDLVFYAASNIPTIKLANFNPDNAEECETYMPYGIKNFKLLEKNKSKLSTYRKIITFQEKFKSVEAIDGTYELVEEFNGETYSTQLSFSISLSDYKASWHVKLLEFEKNKYRGYLNLKNSNYKAFLGYNTGLFPSYVINGDIVTITLAESSNCGMVFGDEYAVINTDLPNSIEFSGATCKNYNFESTCDWNVESKPNYITITPMSGNADTQYTLQVCNTDDETGYAVSEFVIRSCNAAVNTEVVIKNAMYRYTATTETVCSEASDRWVESGTTCAGIHGVDKSVNNVKFVSYDGEIWYNSGIESASTIIEANSPDCGYAERWVESGTTCVGHDKYINSYKQISYDSGATWETQLPIQYSATTLIEPDSADCGHIPELYDYLTFIPLNDTSFTFSGNYISTHEAIYINNLEYSLDSGQTWTEIGDIVTKDVHTRTVRAVQKIMWRLGEKWTQIKGLGTFRCNTPFIIEGNIMSLIKPTPQQFSGMTEISVGIEDNGWYFEKIFEYCEVVSAENLLLPATNLSKGCYSEMFNGCISLKKAPKLPATTLKSYCYYGMFQNCFSLTESPVLSATTLMEYSYGNMFYSIQDMSLSAITCLAEDISASGCTDSWIVRPQPNGVFSKSPLMSNWTIGNNGVPSGWTIVNYTG